MIPAPRAVRALHALGWLGVLAYAVHAVAPTLCGADAFFETWLYNGLILIASVLCLARAARVRVERWAWLALGVGLFAWACAEAYYSIALASRPSPPLPSLADAGWIAFFPCCYVALALLVRERVPRARASLWLDGVIGALAAASFGAALIVQAVVKGGHGDVATVAVDLSYVLGDGLLVAFVIGVFALTGWRPGRAWTLLGIALVVDAVVDGFTVYQGATGGYLRLSTLLEPLVPASLLLLAAAAWQRPRVSPPVRLDGARLMVVPAAFAAVALGLLVANAFSPLHPLVLALAVATLGAVILRMALTFWENIRLLASSRREALTDALTGLHNRRALMLDLEQAFVEVRWGTMGGLEAGPRTLALFDLDGFKAYNDREGHPAGDALLIRLGRRLDDALGAFGKVYRLGGDEFCAILRCGADGHVEMSAAACEALHERGADLEVTTSCGFAVIPDEAADVVSALQLADERLYGNKGERQRATVSRQAGDALLQALEEREPNNLDHVADVSGLARGVGRAVGLAGSGLEEVVRAAELHDVGKVAVPDAILLKPGPLGEREWESMRQHTVAGDRILRAAPALSGVAALVRASHERYDGGGYPDGLAGEGIPLGARIVAVCDAYGAMTSNRPYAGAVSSEVALTELRNCAGLQFDPMVVEVFCAQVSAASVRRDETRADPVPALAAA